MEKKPNLTDSGNTAAIGQIACTSKCPICCGTSDKTATDEFLRPKEVSDYCKGKPSVTTLAIWRSQKVGPRFYKLREGRGGTVLYRRSDIDAWLDGCSKLDSADF